MTPPGMLGRRVLLLSASVGEGHDAAAAAMAGQVLRGGGAAEVLDGLALLGPRLAKFVIRGYCMQVRHAAWSWAIVYTLSRNRRVLRAAGYLLALHGGRRLLQAIDASRADYVVSTYPLVSAALASLRRRGRLQTPCASLITDFDPHPGWSHPDLDANLSVGAGAGVTTIAPPLRSTSAVGSTHAIRVRLGVPLDRRVVLIAGGAWGVGHLREAAEAVATVAGFHALVVTGRNAHLQRTLARELAGSSATVLGYVEGLGSLIGAADLVVQHAGGVTCLEAFAASRPVVMFDPLPGHGKQNARLMESAGLARVARSRRAFCALLESDTYWSVVATDCVAAGRKLFDRPDAISTLQHLAVQRVPARASIGSRLWPALSLAATVVAAILLHGHLADPDFASWAFTP